MVFNFYSTQPKWFFWLTVVLAMHGLILFGLVWKKSPVQVSYEAPAAVMLQWSNIIEAPAAPTPMPVGVTQQQKTPVALKKPPTKNKVRYKLKAVENAKIYVDKREKSVNNEQKETNPEQIIKDQSSKDSQMLAPSYATARSNTLSSRIAAPFNSDSEQLGLARVSWENLVKGRLNRFKKYPPDARRRGRSGVVVVTFSVDAAGLVKSSQLNGSSGTISLDREALEVLERAQPLPRPPEKLLSNGIYTVKMPINFYLSELK